MLEDSMTSHEDALLKRLFSLAKVGLNCIPNYIPKPGSHLGVNHHHSWHGRVFAWPDKALVMMFNSRYRMIQSISIDINYRSTQMCWESDFRIHCTVHIQSTLPKSNLLGLKIKLRLRENSTYEGLKTIEYKEKRT